jgi:hypothetical protein
MEGRRWETRAARLFGQGRCQDALKSLTDDPHEESLNWYELVAISALDCFDKTHRQEYLVLALGKVSAGLERRPRSAVLTGWKSTLLHRQGDEAEARRLYSASKALARENISRGWSPDGLRSDRRVLYEFKWSSMDRPNSPVLDRPGFTPTQP